MSEPTQAIVRDKRCKARVNAHFSNYLSAAKRGLNAGFKT
jgi:hypothetical protein